MKESESDAFKSESNQRKFDAKVAFRCSDDYKELLEEIADEHNLTVSFLVRMSVVRLVRQETKAKKARGEFNV